MVWNQIGKNVRKATNGMSSKIFGMIKPPRSLYSEILRKAEGVESAYPHKQAQKILQEMESKKSQAIAFVRRFQNC